MSFIKSVLLSDYTVPVLFLVVLLLMIVFLIIQAGRNRKHRELVMKDLINSQEKLFNRAAEALAEKLTDYTENILTEKVNTNYIKLVSEDLLPSVNDSARIITELSETVVKRQEMGMEALAERMSELLTSKTRNYLYEEAEIIDVLQQSVRLFSERLTGITGVIEQISVKYENVYEQANSVSETISGAVESLAEKMDDLGMLLANSSEFAAKVQDTILESGKTADMLADSAAGMQKQANEATILLASQHEKTGELLSAAVTSMQQNTELAARTVLDTFSQNLGSASTSIENAVSQLKEISAEIKASSEQFAGGLASAYGRLGSALEERITSAAATISESAANEYQQMEKSAETYSLNFRDSIKVLGDTLEGHITNLQTISQQLNHNISSFNGDVDMSATKFELGMEKSVSAALKEMDSALAEIVRRLVTVTMNIQDAADALPKAVKSIQDQN